MIKITQPNNASLLMDFEENSTTKGIINNEPFELIVNNESDTIVEWNGEQYAVEIVNIDEIHKKVVLKVNSVTHELKIEDELDLMLKQLGIQRGIAVKMNELKAPMPGLVLNILVNEGQEIKKGDALLILEAMKMENSIKAIADGKVKKIICKSGKAVEKNEILIVFE
jgi:biotin carboxyl carrier protein